MMLWFKNAIIYQINKDTLLDKDAVEKAVNAALFTPCGSTDSTKSGWTSPYGEAQSDDKNIMDINGQLLLRFKKEIKILPSPVIKKALAEKIAKQEDTLGRQLKKSEKLSLKDEVLIDLLPRAFSKYQFYWLWIDTKNKRIIIDSSSFKQAEDMLALLRKELGSLALTPFSTEKPLEQIMTSWVIEKQPITSLSLGSEIELKDSAEESCVVRCKNQEVTSDEILVHINAGKLVNKLQLIDENGSSYLLNKDCTLKGIKFDSEILEQNEDFMAEEYDKKLEADFLIMNHALSDIIDRLIGNLTLSH